MIVYQTLNPTTETVERSFDLHTPAQMKDITDRAEHVWKTDWKLRSIAQRKEIVSRAADLLRRDRQHHASLIATEMGKALPDALEEIDVTADILSFYANGAEEFLAPTPLKVKTGQAKIINQPLGIIYCIEPWNFPYYQLARVAGPNLMAGNVVIAKHAPNVPQCALAFEKLFHDAGAPVGAYANIFLDNDQSAELIKDERIRGVALTGSERAGQAVAAQAGAALKKDTMELGGSDAFIVLDDADLDLAVKWAVWGRFANNGQVCTAAKRMIVHEKVYDAFLDGLKAAITRFRIGNPLDRDTTHGPMSSLRAMELALDQTAEAVKGGATLVAGGKRMDRKGFFMEPTILTDVSKDNPVFYQEIFGPVAVVHKVASEQAAIDLANDSPYGLGGAVFSRDIARAEKVAEQVETGMVFINTATAAAPELPFGGIKNSGFGRELSFLGIEEFINRKLVRIG
ncbi:MAG: NAD-dependent succinate-semialdehyde dehydrogenase [Gluconobacter potus]|uniref:NAD-dependent succinate-semialdehyde dehydrogenase n=1 Tax=Gluconobacter potus TaxID=2724927 RepID=A0ABR9YIE3_9PROT|nr:MULTISPECIES: NAD-dependent succinate-semialdehyde dehydrogenase [Gluconobacter]MBF0863465.1 NAD-dependent succinate-semialdehyde dehydrogenase [Gluconobacter sp. R71656]MBF0866272.1 NAD-dependent succinate-semialdehyde dehydrogenase [Gluconobacter sp. R75628]MBF0872600.1 NAD-dependent succinate-semialdehyde dehydrogenase [Gluconobacter sp. R75629]MBF0881566.1 NAD-dependent succinate-semialdehyde dehydrogenase [Gluconobacter potus]